MTDDLTPIETAIALLWEGGRDTLDIARRVAMRESEIYRRLPAIRAKRRTQREKCGGKKTKSE